MADTTVAQLQSRIAEEWKRPGNVGRTAAKAAVGQVLCHVAEPLGFVSRLEVSFSDGTSTSWDLRTSSGPRIYNG